jgi:Leucine-rich repeat (LRR) protein
MIYCPALDIIERFDRLQTLKIELSKNADTLNDEMLEHLFNIIPSSLTHIILKSCTKLEFPRISTKSVQKLSLSACIALQGLTLLGDCKSLQELGFGFGGYQSCRSFSKLEIDETCRTGSLSLLDFTMTRISDEQLTYTLDALSPYNNIEHILLASCSFITDLSMIAKYCSRSLKTIDISHSNVTDDGLSSITCSNDRVMAKLLMITCRNTSTLVRTRFIGACLPVLKQLQLHFCAHLERIEMYDLIELNKVDLDRTNQLNLVEIRNCPKLSLLDISNTQINDRTLAAVVHHVPSLIGLYVRRCMHLLHPHIIHDTLQELKMDNCKGVQQEPVIKCPAMESLSLTGTPHVTQETIDKVCTQCCSYVF